MHIIARPHEHLHFVQVGSRAYIYKQHFFNCVAYFCNYAALLHFCEHTLVHQSELSMLVGTHDEFLCARRWQVLGLLQSGALEGSQGPALLLG